MASPPLQVDSRVQPPTPYRPLLWLAIAVGLGVTADHWLHSLAAPSVFGRWWLVGAAAWFVAAVLRRRGRFQLASLLIMASAWAVGAAWHDWRWQLTSADDLARFAGATPQPACIEAILADHVRIIPPGDASPLRAIPARMISEATVRVVEVRDGRQWRTAAGLSRLRVAGSLVGVAPGDRVKVFAQLARPEPPLNPGDYDWAAAQRRDGRLTELFCENPQCVAVVESAPWMSVERALFDVRSWCAAQLADNVPTRDAPLVLATLLGDQERLSDSTKDAFLETGSIHLLVISGAHVAMLAWIVWQLAGAAGLAVRTQAAATLGVVLLYAAIVGPEPSVVRATVVTATAVIALTAGRRTSAGNLFGAAALAVMAINPSETFRSGTQFSFLAVAVLILFAEWRPQLRSTDPLRRHIAETRPWWVRTLRKLGRAAVVLTLASIAVGIAMAPLVAYHFHVVAPAGVLLTPLASPLVGIAIGAGLGVLTIGWLVPPVGLACGAVCGWALHLTEMIVRGAQHVPGSYAYSCGPPAWWLVVFYGAIAALAIVPALRPHWRWQLAAALAWAAVGYGVVGAGRTRPGEVRCTFLAVGHGTCAVIELPSGQTVLYDAGSLGSPEMAHRIVSSYLWSRGIGRIDAIVLSHADIDHYNAVPGLLERFPVGVVYVSPMMFDPLATGGKLTAPNYLRDVLATSGVPLRQIWMNDRLRTLDPGVTIEVLHPPREGVMGRDNANSILLTIDFAGRRILLPGDLESPGLERVMADPPLDCDVLLAPHHGSLASDPPGFAAWCSPESVVFSGPGPERTLPAMAAYQSAGAGVWHTAERGAVTCLVDDQGVRVSSYLGGAHD